MAIKYVLFDFDGTLIDSNEAVISALNFVAINFRGKPFQGDELNEILGKPLFDQMAYLSLDQTKTLSEMYRIEYRRIQNDLTKIYEGVSEMLERIKKMGIRVGIVSNKGRNGINNGIVRFELETLIDIAISIDDVKFAKPHSEGVLKALRYFGVKENDIHKAISETLFVGDSGHDIETAKNVGCMSVLVAWTLIDMNRLLALNPDFVIQTPLEMLNILKILEAQ